MKIGLVHGTLTKIGGGEKVAIGFLEAMNKMGIEPTLFTGDEELDTTKINEIFGKKFNFSHVKVGTVKLRSTLGLYRNTLPRLFTTKMRDYDLIVDTSGLNVAPILKSKRMIRYVHNPIMHRLREVERKGLFWRAYRYPYELISRRMPEDCIIVCNSNFTSNRIKSEWQRDSTVIYPPVELKKGGSKKRQFVSVGRFSFEKRYDEIVRLSKMMPDMKFTICGALFDKDYYVRIANLAKDSKNLTLKHDVSNTELDTILSESMYFLHTMHDEDFGIAIVEAMSSGCIPIVHRSGGPEEIVDNVNLTFNGIEEVPSIIGGLSGRENSLKEIMIVKASEYSYDKFVIRSGKMIADVLNL